MGKILIVEDDELNLKLLKDILIHEKYEVIEAKNGVEGIELAEKEEIDLILMDIQMPGMDGIETLKRIKQIQGCENIPVIALTAYAMKGDRERFLSKGFVDYISKPIRLSELMRKIKYYLP